MEQPWVFEEGIESGVPAPQASRNAEDAAHRYLLRMQSFPELSLDEEKRLFKQIRAGDCAARERLVLAHLRLVVMLARRYAASDSRVQLLDLVHDGAIGLFKAIDHFDCSKGFRFSTYAKGWVVDELIASFRLQVRAVRIPERLEILFGKCRKIEREHLARYGTEPSFAMVTKKLALTPAQAKCFQAALSAISTTPLYEMEREDLDDDSECPLYWQ